MAAPTTFQHLFVINSNAGGKKSSVIFYFSLYALTEVFWSCGTSSQRLMLN